MERVLPMVQPAAAGRGRGSRGVVVALALYWCAVHQGGGEYAQ